MKGNSLKGTIMRCGIISAGAGVLLFLIIAYAGDIWDGLAYLGRFFPSRSVLMVYFEWVGRLNFSIHVAAACLHGWVFCVWWKTGFRSLGFLPSNLLVAAISLMCFFVGITLIMGAVYQDGLRAIADGLLAVLVYVSFCVVSVEFIKRERAWISAMDQKSECQ